jgi:hypothetical protein
MGQPFWTALLVGRTFLSAQLPKVLSRAVKLFLSRVVTLAVVDALLVAAVVGVSIAKDAQKSEPQLGHMVFFTLKERTPDAREKLAGLCRKYLDKQEGTVYFSVGTLAEDLKRDVNDLEFDVALHLVFKDKASYDIYADHPRHLEFIDAGKASWAKVRVFDSYIPAK